MNLPLVVPATKLCRGPAHPAPTRLPLSKFYVRRATGKPFGRCRICTLWPRLQIRDGAHGFIEVAKVETFARELVARCGSIAAASDLSTISTATLGNLTGSSKAFRTRYARADTVARLLVALAAQRQADRRNGSSRLGANVIAEDEANGRGHCPECGGDLYPTRFTRGCQTCLDRKRQLAKRAREGAQSRWRR